MSDQYGPGMGTAVGLAWGAVRNQNRRNQESLDVVRAELAQQTKSAFYQEAFKCAAADVLQSIVQELKDIESGKLQQRCFSDPKNRADRNQAYAEAAASHVDRLSHGRVRMDQKEIKRLSDAGSFK